MGIFKILLGVPANLLVSKAKSSWACHDTSGGAMLGQRGPKAWQTFFQFSYSCKHFVFLSHFSMCN